MFLATFGITVSLFTTAAYLIFYSQNELLKGFLKGLDFMGKITMVFLFTFAFVGSLFDLFNFYVYQTNRGQ